VLRQMNTPTPSNGYMLDTTLFNSVLDGKISVASFAGLRLLVTGIQASELRATKSPHRRADLLTTFEDVNAAVALCSSFAWDVEGAGWDQAYWNDGSGNFQKMLDRLRVLDPKSKDPLNQLRDILIAETAIKNGVTMVSDDKRLRQVVLEFGGRAIDHPSFEHEADCTASLTQPPTS
jgi:predicted nucleic acid-binding protein